MNLLNEWLSWGGCAVLLVGLYLVGKRRLSGFYLAFVAELAWIAWGIRTGAHALVAMSVAILAMYAHAIWNWSKGTS